MVDKIGVVGAGQLARMMASDAIELNLDLSLLAESEEGCAVPAIVKSDIGHYEDYAELYKFSQGIDVLTFDHEHVPYDHLKRLESEHQIRISPSPDALLYAKDKLKMRQFMEENGFPNPRWTAVKNTDEILKALEDLGGTAVVKTPRGGYDGKGVEVLKSPEDVQNVQDWFEKHDELLVEEMIPFDAELSSLCARNDNGDFAAWDIVETIQKDGICSQVIAPAQGIEAEIFKQAYELADQIGMKIGITGVFAVEMFYVKEPEPKIYINELAMRPHNSGHWTQNGSETSQFEQHLRAVANLPLGSPNRTADYTVMQNILGGPENPDETYPKALDVPWVKFHLYGKESRPGRKVGHINVSGDDLDLAKELAKKAHDAYMGEHDE